MKTKLSILMVLAFIIGAITLSLGVSANSISTSSFISNSARRDYMDKMINEYLETQPDFMNVLKQGKSVIMFFEGGSDNEDNATYSNNPNYYHVSAVCIVLKWNESEQKVYIAYASENCTTIPDHPLAYGSYSHGYGSQYGTATLKDGIYNVYTVNHKGEYSGLNVRLSNGSSSVPAVYMKSDGTFSEMNASGINIHTRTTSYVSSSSNPWSAGCILVGGAAPLTEYNSFINTITPTNITKAATTYKGYSTYYYNTTGSNVGLLVINRFLYRDKMMQIYKNNDAINEITKFSRATIGNVDCCIGAQGSIYVGGWALNYDTPNESLDIHVYIGGTKESENAEKHIIKADLYREDIENGSYHGFETSIPTSKYGTHDVYFYAVKNNGESTQLNYSPFTVTITRGIEGSVDCCIGEEGSIYVGGWALDYDNPSEVLDIHVYIGGTKESENAEKHIIKADLYREDIENGSYHGFETSIPTSKYGTHDVYFYAVKNNGESTQLNYSPFTVTITRGIEGSVDCCMGEECSIYVGGWALDYDNPSEVLDIHVYIGGTKESENAEKHIIKADLYREDIENGSYHGFETSIPTTKYGTHDVYFYAVKNDGESKQLNYSPFTITITRGSNAEVVIDSLEILDETYELIDNIPDATFFAEVTITNQLSANKIYILIATYDTDGRMLDIDFLYANPQIGQTVTFGTQIKNSDGKVAKVKAFVISDLKSFSALAEAKEITKT